MTDALAVLWEDPHGLAVSKPAGVLTQGRSPGAAGTLESLVRSYLRPDDPVSVYLGTVHRLDRPVSGAILWAKTPKAARRWAEQFASREVQKEYWAIVEGDGSELGLSGTWEDWLTDPDRTGSAHKVDPGVEGASHALTRFEISRERTFEPGYTWLKLWPETGRTHQLRVQLASRGTPIVGDARYGSIERFAEGIALHARSLTIKHPITRRPIVVEAPLPDSWSRWLR